MEKASISIEIAGVTHVLSIMGAVATSLGPGPGPSVQEVQAEVDRLKAARSPIPEQIAVLEAWIERSGGGSARLSVGEEIPLGKSFSEEQLPADSTLHASIEASAKLLDGPDEEG
jgi:hypothetical protein